ncbi:hypothetical protein HK097_005767 [Rhizophlyctis rosea]|uniref:Uncharacterized protein n=1 Tax=Rhizophlyctis rosea TaxID=64517 RepID=A0AAD5X8A9_9FUNG|nr:hypothetical protein HK097_005767 [Rhizophlyctis rosea]
MPAPKSGSGLYGVDFQQRAKSVTSSSTSRKEYRRLKARQARLKENLLAPVTKFSMYVRLACLVIMGLLIANYLVSSSLFTAPTAFLNSILDATRGRRASALIAQEIRLMQYWAQQGDADAWAYHRKIVSDEVDGFETRVIPAVFAYADSPATIQILQPKTDGINPPLDVVPVNVYTLARVASQGAANLLVYIFDAWKDASFVNNKDLRQWFINAVRFSDAFNTLTKEALVAYLAGSSSRTVTVIILMLLMVLGILAAGVFLFVTLRHGRKKQNIVLKTLIKIPSADRRRIVADLEEEIEGLFEIEDNQERREQMKLQNVEAKSIFKSHTFMYMVALVVMGTLALSQFIPPLMSGTNSDKTARMIMISNERRYDIQMINYLVNELPAGDTTVWSDYEVQQQLTLRIYGLTTRHRSLLAGTAGVPSTSTVPELDQICRSGGICLADIGCENRPFNISIGFDKDLLYTGVDHLVEVQIEHATKYLMSNSYTYDNPDLYYMMNLQADLADGIRQIDSTLIDVERKRSANFLNITKVLFSIAIVTFVLFYLLIFYVIISAARTQMAMMVTVLFWIPSEISAKSTEIQKYLVSGTVEASEDS